MIVDRGPVSKSSGTANVSPRATLSLAISDRDWFSPIRRLEPALQAAGFSIRDLILVGFHRAHH
jgi:hypothetical protein